MNPFLLFAGGCGGIALIISLDAVSRHLTHYTYPKYQLYICRILLMVPVYTVTSIMSLVMPELSLFFGLIRDSYEAYVLYSFFSLLVSYLGGSNVLTDYFELKSHLRHPWPLNKCFRIISLDRHSLNRLRRCTLQFVIIKPVTAVLALLLHRLGYYETANFSLYNGYIYLAVINNISVSVSLYSLVLFYKATESRLQPFNPVAKFLCIKMVVFFSFWQACVLETMLHFGLLDSEREAIEAISPKSKAEAIQNFLICVEMLFAAIAHQFSFSYKEFIKDAVERKPLIDNLMQVLDVQDVVEDAHNTFILSKNKKTEEMVDKKKIRNNIMP